MTLPNMTTRPSCHGFSCHDRYWRCCSPATTAVASAQEQPRRQRTTQNEQQRPEQRPGDTREGVLHLLPADSVTQHTVDIPGGKLAYTATAGTLSLFDQSGERAAAIYYTSYVREHRGLGTGPSPSPSTAGPARRRPT